MNKYATPAIVTPNMIMAIAVVLVLSAVFIPVAFMGGLAGVMYKQFAITIVISVIISANVPIIDTGTARDGINVALQFCRNT